MKKHKNNWYVITGAPSSGKTTIIQELADKGFRVLYEQARIYIEKELKKGKSLSEIRRNELDFQKKILKFKITAEKKLKKKEIIFFDRGIPDSIGYFKKCGVTDDKFLEQSLKKCYYKKIFFFESLKFKKDHARTETRKEAKLLERFLEESYKNLGMEIIRIPRTTVKKRLLLILQHL